MIRRLSVFAIAEMLEEDHNANWTRQGALSMAQWLDDNMADNDELDIVAVRSEFSEYKSLWGWVADNFNADTAPAELELTEEDWREAHEDEEDDLVGQRDDRIRNYILEHGVYLEHPDGVIVQAW